MKAEQIKKSWGEGPWLSEPDRMEFRHRGLPCLIRRNMALGILCGYVGVPPGHPWHGKNYDDVDAGVDGGLTYSGKCDGEEGEGICHVAEKGEDADVWWLGFDAGHSFDLVPVMVERGLSTGTYRDVSYMKRECISLADQVMEAK